jgi:hypothetical protein
VTEPTLLELVSGALRLDRSAFDAIEQSSEGLRDAAIVLVLAGVSMTLGHSVVLFLNRITLKRWALALVLGGFELVLEALIWITSVWLVVGLLGVSRPHLVETLDVIGLAYAPFLFGVLVFLPYVGLRILWLLRLWMVLAAIVGTTATYDIAPVLAAAAVAGAFLVRWLLLHVFARGVKAADEWYWRASTGRARPIESSEALLAPGVEDRGG